MKKRKWNKQEVCIIKEYYETEMKEVIMGLLPNRTWKAIMHMANKLAIKRKRYSNSTNIKFFDSWSNDMAYILGFIAADGNIGSKKSTMQIHLSYKDIDHLEKIKNTIVTTNKINVFDTIINNIKYKKCSLCIGSVYIIDRLKDLGVGPKKSLTLSFPNVPEKYLSHFIRGYFDGDGSIDVKRKNVDIIGTQQFLEKISHISRKYSKVAAPIVKKKSKKNAYHIRYGPKASMKFLDWIYNEHNLCLDRKFEQYKVFKNSWSNYKSIWDESEIEILKLYQNNIKAISLMLSDRTISAIKHKMCRI